MQFLEQQQQIVTEGIFRKHGNLKKQQVLKQRLNRGTPITLDDGEFSVHECAAVLKGFLQVRKCGGGGFLIDQTFLTSLWNPNMLNSSDSLSFEAKIVSFRENF